MKISLRSRHALTVAYGAFSHKIDDVTVFRFTGYWLKSYNDFAEWVDFAHCPGRVYACSLRSRLVSKHDMNVFIVCYPTIRSTLFVMLSHNN